MACHIWLVKLFKFIDFEPGFCLTYSYVPATCWNMISRDIAVIKQKLINKNKLEQLQESLCILPNWDEWRFGKKKSSNFFNLDH